MEINSLIFKNPVLKKNYEEEVPIDFILFCYFVIVCGTRSNCIFFADDCEKKIISPVSNVYPTWRLNVDFKKWIGVWGGGGTFFEFLILNS